MNTLSRIPRSHGAFAKCHGARCLSGFIVALALAAGAMQTWAGVNATRPDRAAAGQQQQAGAPVLPSQARPYGYSLDDMARLTAAFNTGDRSGPPPNSPFKILYYNTVTGATAFDVAQGTFLYVPLLYNDNSLPVIGHFPASAENRPQALQYWFSQSEFGVTMMDIVIDGNVVSLGAGNVSGVSFAQPLTDGATQYLTAAALIAPLSRGAHTVEIRFRATGDALRVSPIDQYFPDGSWAFSIAYNVNVR